MSRQDFLDLGKVAAPILVGLATWLYQWRTRHRGKLKTDLEILELYSKISKDSPKYLNLVERIENRMERAYPHLGDERTDVDWSDFWVGIAFAVSALFFATYPGTSSARWWYYGASLSLAVASSVALLKAFERKRRSRKLHTHNPGLNRTAPLARRRAVRLPNVSRHQQF